MARMPEAGLGRFGSATAGAWRDSALAALSGPARSRLLESATEVRLNAGDVVPLGSPGTETSRTGQPGLMVAGLLRVFVSATSKRQVTTQYAGPSDVFGIPILADGAAATGLFAAAQALVDSTILLMSAPAFAELAQTDLTVARVSIEGLRNAMTSSVTLVAENVLWPLRQRVARHLLDLAVREGDRVVVPATVQTIADATGTVREVVTRLLRELRDEGLIARSDGTLTLLDLGAIHAVSTGSTPKTQL